MYFHCYYTVAQQGKFHFGPKIVADSGSSCDPNIGLVKKMNHLAAFDGLVTVELLTYCGGQHGGT